MHFQKFSFTVEKTAFRHDLSWFCEEKEPMDSEWKIDVLEQIKTHQLGSISLAFSYTEVKVTLNFRAGCLFW